MNKIDAFFVMVSLLLVWIFANFLLPYKVIMFIYPAIAAWWIGTSIVRLVKKLAKETDRDFLEKMFEVADSQERCIREMYDLVKLAERTNHSLQARMDELMFEYCPEDMTPEQIANYEAHVRAAGNEEEVERALKH